MIRLNPHASPAPEGGDLSGTVEGLGTQSPKANVLVLDFNRDFSLRHVQPYTLVQNSWEVYIGHFVNPQHDGVLLYDRTMGEARLLSFNATLQLAHEQALHNLSGNWQVYSGDFSGSGQAQVVLYDPSSGNGQFLSFARDLSLAAQKSYSGWGTNQVLYVGHFGRPALSIMLYDPAAHQSTFLAFDASLQITRQVTVQSWDQHWHILVGAFLDRSRCLARGNCTTGDDILVLDRRTGLMQQYVFSFRRQLTVYDNRMQAFLREGVLAAEPSVSVDSMFSVLSTLETNIQQEELY